MLDGRYISQRRLAYANCIADAGEHLRMLKVFGKKADVVSVAERRLWTLLWARHVLCSYLLEGEECKGQWSASDSDVLCATRIADPGCVECACGPEPVPVQPDTPVDPPVDGCTQPTSLHIVVPPGESVDNITLDVSGEFTGYFMIEGDTTVHASGDFDVSLSSGEYCLYTTDASGVPNGAATYIYLYANSLTTLDVSAWTATTIYLYADSLTTLDASAWTATYISLYANSLTTLDASAWTAATFISLYANSLTTLDASAWTATYIYLYANSLTTLDGSAWTAATYIYLSANSLTTLDISAWTAAEIISLTGSSLTSITPPSVFASGLSSFNAQNCPLDQESVDAILAAMVANPAITTATIHLDTLCAAPSASGYADKATLQGRGCTVVTN